MHNEWLEQIIKLTERGEEFAIAQVISREIPSSGKPGDKAIILKDGSLIGWIGGGCVKGIAIKESLRAMKEKSHRLVKISPDLYNEDIDENHKSYQMTCHSGGSMELFIEPVIPSLQIIIAGKSNIARALARTAAASNYRVVVMAKNIDKGMFPEVKKVKSKIDFTNLTIDHNTFIVVSTQGENDEESVKGALLTSCNYVGFISSKKKAEKVIKYLKAEGVNETRLKQLRSPVGLDIKAKLPEEIAISILADIILNYRSETESKVADDSLSITESIDKEKFYINPVCNIPITIADAKHIVNHKGHKIYFCCDGCKISYDQEPERYIKILEKR